MRRHAPPILRMGNSSRFLKLEDRLNAIGKSSEHTRTAQICKLKRHLDAGAVRRRNPALTRTILFALLAIGLFAGAKHEPQVQKSAFRFPDHIPVPRGNQITTARVELGKMLFFDPRLSGSGNISCASCHNPALGWSDGLSLAQGDGTAPLTRSTPTIINVAFEPLLMWDGRFRNLEDQVMSPIETAAEMHNSDELLVETLRDIPAYVRAFAKAYPGEELTPHSVAKAVSAFERTIISRNSPFDHWVDGNDKAISASAKRGFYLFTGKANCVACHQGFNFTDDGFHNIGLSGNTDPGRYALLPIKILKGAFKTPTLRDVAYTAPYMHNGSYQTLEEVVDHYDRGGDDKENLDPNIKPLGLSEQEKVDLVQFMKSLTGHPVMLTLPRLPQ